MSISIKEFRGLASIIYNKFGINIPENKKILITTRLNGILAKHKFDSYAEYIGYINTDKTGSAASELANAMSTNLTFFYRENAHFRFFENKFLPEITKRVESSSSHDIRIWSAGCSTGEEPYMLVILMMDFLGQKYNLWDSGVLATDIDANVLKLAEKGVYPEERFNKMPPQYKLRFFKKISATDYIINSDVASEVLFRRLNLMNDFPFKKQFHAIFCRNVMIYFDKPTRERLVKKYYEFLEPGGYLFIGHSETIDRNLTNFEYIMPALYRKPLR